MVRGFATRGKSGPPGSRPGRVNVGMNPSPTAAPKNSKADVSANAQIKKLLFSMDYGTKTVSLAFRIAKAGDSPTPNNVYDVHFSERDYFAPQAVAWGKDGKSFWGYQVEKALKRKVIKPEDVVELWKLLLYKDHESSDIVEQIETQLGDHTVGDLIREHLKAIIEEAKENLKRNQTMEYTADEIDELPMELFLSVPQMWKAPANLTMMKAAKDAGISYVELVYEPQCAAAYFTHNVKDRLPKQLEVGDVLQIADIGGGTGDFVSYTYKTDSDAGAKVGLKLTKEPQGSLCGSEFVNQNFVKWLKKRTPNFDSKCNDLGLTPTACVKQASAAFESIKIEFTELSDQSAFITIRGPQGAKVRAWEVELTSQDIASFFEPVILEIIKNINQQMDPKTRVLIVPGGFGRSEYLIDRLRNEFEGIQILGRTTPAVGAYQPVARGALLRYKDIQVRGMPSKESLGIAQVEVYDATLHPDATFFTGEQMSSNRTCRKGPMINHKIVEKDPFDNDVNIVWERWCPILKKGDIKVPGQALTTETWQQAFVQLGQQDVRVQVYWTESNIREHDPIRTGKDGLSPLRLGIEAWGDELVMALPNLDNLGFETMQSDKKGMVYEIFYRIVMECDGANIKVKWQIASPGTQPYDEDGEHHDSNVELAQDEVFELCDASHNPFPRLTPN